ncbi:MAG TPA: hypothetical protein PKE17_19370, partial [Saprospiraceae bacterium]|nr:hypothetical protein [Saprospiraceae bacterium]
TRQSPTNFLLALKKALWRHMLDDLSVCFLPNALPQYRLPQKVNESREINIPKPRFVLKGLILKKR